MTSNTTPNHKKERCEGEVNTIYMTHACSICWVTLYIGVQISFICLIHSSNPLHYILYGISIFGNSLIVFCDIINLKVDLVDRGETFWLLAHFIPISMFNGINVGQIIYFGEKRFIQMSGLNTLEIILIILPAIVCAATFVGIMIGLVVYGMYKLFKGNHNTVTTFLNDTTTKFWVIRPWRRETASHELV